MYFVLKMGEKRCEVIFIEKFNNSEFFEISVQ